MLKVSDREIISLAIDRNIPIGQAAALAIEEGMIPERYAKNLEAISAPDQALICKSRVLVCGCGGLGGHIVLMLARLGFGFLRIVDPDRFDPSNLNRQPFCMESTLYRPKVIATWEILANINPLVEVEALQEPLNSLHFNNIDLVIDGLDTPRDRIMAEKEAIGREIPFVHGAVRGWWGQVTTVLPGDSPKLPSLYKNTSYELQKYEEETGTPVPTVSLIASVQVFEAIRLATQKKPLYAGKLFYWDGETGTAIVIPF